MARAYPDHPHPSQRHYIQHVGNAGEYHVPVTTFTVDGFCQENNTVYEFHGRFWHGCPKCFPVRNERRQRLCDRTMDDAYQKTHQIMEQLCTKGYRIEETWECEWDHLKQTRSEVQTYVDSLQFVESLNPLDAFCGGRTNVVKLYHHVTPGQKIHYIGYTSLYPLVKIRRASVLKVIPSSSRNRVTPTSTTTLVSSNVKYFLHPNCTIQRCLTVTPVNSPFLSLPAACKKKCKNLP